jgi:hypothetical protein
LEADGIGVPVSAATFERDLTPAGIVDTMVASHHD